MKIKIIIPARYNSSRFPGKPLVDLNGRSMIRRVWDKATIALNYEDVYIATDSKLIFDHSKKFTDNVIMTSIKCPTGTDRIADCINKIPPTDIFINIQGDEPLIDPKDIKLLIKNIKREPMTIYNFMKKINSLSELKSTDVPKVITDENNNLLYMTRLPSPYKINHKKAFKQVCIYSFPKKVLKIFGKNKKKSKNEKYENIEILRLVDKGYKIKMIETKNNSYAIDRSLDVKKVMKILKYEKN